jgi:uncharacterized membrane protein (DUF485 family)
VRGESRLYCEGWPHTGDRSLKPDELATLNERVRTELRRRRQLTLRLRVIGALLVSATVGFVVWNPGDQPIGLTIAAAFGIMLLAAGALGVIEAAIWSPRACARWLFRLGLACVVVMLGAFDSLPEGLAIGVMVPACIFGIFGGAASLWARASSVRRSRSAFAVVELDLADGHVMCFGGVGSDGEDEYGPSSPLELAIEILPRSRLHYRLNGAVVPEWETVELHRVAVARAEHWELSYSDQAADLQRLDEDHTYRERALTPAEVAEVRKHRARLARRTALEALAAAFTAAILVRFVETVLQWRYASQISQAGWIAIGLIVILRVWRAAVVWRALGADLANGRVLLAWSRGGSRDDPPTSEILSRSLLVWTVEGEPPTWRRAP